MNRPAVVLSAWIAALGAAAPSQDVPAPERFVEARAVASRLVAEQVAPAIAIAVLQDDVVVWAEGFGMADLAAGRPATADTMFRLASISKPFTATALMCLVEDGTVELDEPANRYLDRSQLVARRGDASAMTLRRLANHTAGMPTHWSFFYRGSAPPPRDVTIGRYGFAAWPPATRTNYSNLAFGVLDHVVALRSGKPFAAFLQERVLTPLAMGHTSVGAPPDGAAAAVGYQEYAGTRFVPVVDYGFDHDGASAVWSSARDLMRFARLFVHDGTVDGVRVLDAALVRSMREPSGEVAGNQFGIAWRVDAARGRLRISHTGGMPGVSTALEVFPGARAAVAVLTNVANRRATNECLRAILPALLPGEGDEPRPAVTAPRPGGAAGDEAPHGTFRGTLHHWAADLPVELVHAGTRRARLRLGDAEVPVDVDDQPGRVVLRGSAMLPTTDAFHGVPQLTFELDVEGDRLCGVCYARADGVFQLPHWVDLRLSDAAK